MTVTDILKLRHFLSAARQRVFDVFRGHLPSLLELTFLEENVIAEIYGIAQAIIAYGVICSQIWKQIFIVLIPDEQSLDYISRKQQMLS